MAWVKIEYWTPEETREIVASVECIEKSILGVEDTQFVKLENVRWIEVMEIDDALLEEHDDLELDLDDLPDDVKEEIRQIEDEIDEDEEDEDFEDDDDLLDEVIVRQEDDFDFGTSSVMYLKREHILSFSPVREDYVEYWDSTVGDEE